MPVQFTPMLIDQIIKGRCADFADLMGMRKTAEGTLQVNVFVPGATGVEVLQRNGRKVLGVLRPLHTEGLFSGAVSGKKLVPYKLRVHYGDTVIVQEDPYRFPSRLDKAEMQLFARGMHEAAWQLLGAQRCNCDDVDGTQFVLWAPTAQRVSVLCDLNRWDGRCHVLRQHPAFGLWELFLPGFGGQDGSGGGGYRFEVLVDNQCQPGLPFDPFARQTCRQPVPCAQLAAEGGYCWQDQFWQQVARDFNGQGSALAIRELVIAIKADECSLGWQQSVPPLLDETRALGFTHVLPVLRLLPGTSSNQHAVCSLLTPDPALCTPNELRQYIDKAHETGLGVLWDVSLLAVLQALGSSEVPDQLLEPEILDGPLMGVLLGYFSYWRESFHVDGFRVRDVDGVLQLQMPRALQRTRGKNSKAAAPAGNPFIREWLSQLVQRLRNLHPGLLMLVETSMTHEPFTGSLEKGGMGFDYRIQPASAPVPGQQKMQVQARIAQLVTALRDGNRDQSLLSLSWPPGAEVKNPARIEVPGIELLLLALWTLPGRKLLQMNPGALPVQTRTTEGGRTQAAFSRPDGAGGATQLVRELNQLYCSSPALYEIDASHEGIAVLLDRGQVFAYERRGRHAQDLLLIVLNTGASETDIELAINCAGRFALRYHTSIPQKVEDLLPKVVQSAPGSTGSVNNNYRQKLGLRLPAYFGAIYAWQG